MNSLLPGDTDLFFFSCCLFCSSDIYYANCIFPKIPFARKSDCKPSGRQTFVSAEMQGETVRGEEGRMSQVALSAAGMCSRSFQGDGCCCICLPTPPLSPPPRPHLPISPHTPPPAHSRHSAGWLQALERLIPEQRVFRRHSGNHLSRGCEQ